MSELKASLFGKLSIQQGELKIRGMETKRVQELFSYLLIFRNHPHPRELLCETLWGDQSSVSPRKYLRQTLWRLQSAMKQGSDIGEIKLLIDNDWIQLDVSTNFGLDVAEFEKVFHSMKGKQAPDLSLRDFKLLEYAVGLYKGDLLEGWYAEWCVFERERFQIMHLLLLDKLVQLCELHKKYEVGIAYGMEILRHDHAYERTHRQLMRLYFMTGNRTRALYQYERCVQALRDELGVEPSESTKQLYAEIRSDRFSPQAFPEEKEAAKTKVRTVPALRNMLHRLNEVSVALNALEHKIQEELKTFGDGVSGSA
jgi:DNA-binding SARP family transcriptional activator